MTPIDLVGCRINHLIVLDAVRRNGMRREWLCRCDCGKELWVSVSRLRRVEGRKNSCGCKDSRCQVLPDGGAAKNSLYHKYQVDAAKRGREFLLTKEQFLKIVTDNCYYCGEAPSNLESRGKHSKFMRNGIDRKDNNLGYTADNSVACCMLCNYIKRDMSIEQFSIHVRKLASRSALWISQQQY